MPVEKPHLPGSMPRPSTSLRPWEEKSTAYLRALRLDSIRSKLLAFALLATLIPALSTAIISYVQNKRALTEKITETLQGVSSQAERELDLWLKQRLFDLKVFSVSYEVTENLERLSRGSTGPSLRRLTDYLAGVSQRVGDYQEILVLDPQGRTIASTARPAGTVQLTPDWRREIRTEDAIVGRIQRDSATGQITMPVAVAIFGTRGAFLGVLTAKLNLRAVNEVLTSFAARASGYLYVITSDGTIVTAAPDPGITPGSTKVSAEALDRLSEDEGTAVEYTGLDGAPAVGTLHRIRRLHWAVVAELPSAEAFRQVTRLRNITVAVVAGLLLAVGGLSYFLATLIVRPLDRLSAGAAKVAGGDLTVDLPVGGGEVGYLTTVFNEMVARLRGSREELERLSITDALTGLFNRRHLIEVLAAEVRRVDRHDRNFAVLMIDIDHFKEYNDQLGHLAGDEALRKVAAVISEGIRDVDAAARYGGEEFVVVLPETDADGAAEVAERIRARLGKEKFDGGKITLSVGVAEFPTHGKTPDAMLAAADAALYEAKNAGRDRVVRAGADTKRSPRETGAKG
jgi:diguanylate cyclase (GGDEF)-like protein